MLKNLKALREEKHLNQIGLAMELHTSQASVSAYERGERVPDIDVAEQIADFFDVSVDYLLGRTEVKKALPVSGLSALENNILLNLQKLDANRQQQVAAFIQGMLT